MICWVRPAACAADRPFCALRKEGNGMAEGMKMLGAALAALPEVRELMTRERAPSPCRALQASTARSLPLRCGSS